MQKKTTATTIKTRRSSRSGCGNNKIVMPLSQRTNGHRYINESSERIKKKKKTNRKTSTRQTIQVCDYMNVCECAGDVHSVSALFIKCRFSYVCVCCAFKLNMRKTGRISIDMQSKF